MSLLGIMRYVMCYSIPSVELTCHHILRLVVAAWGQECSRTRPADILVTNWDNGISAAFENDREAIKAATTQ